MNRFLLWLLLLILLQGVTSQSSVSSWVYQLQGVDIDELQNTHADIFVIDYSREGDDISAFTTDDLNAIRNLEANRKVLAYISIGEAEDYRFYWNDSWISNPPEFLDEENPNWVGNYKVKYWDPAWQQIIKSYLDRIIAAGFDGLYLDIIDAYEYYENNPNARELMIDLVAEIRTYVGDDMLIFPQNGEAIVNERYLTLIDGIAREEVYVIATNEQRDSSETATIESYLDQYLAAGKTVLTVDYADDDNLISYAIESSQAKGYVPYVTDVNLDRGPLGTVTQDSNFSLFGLIALAILSLLKRNQKFYKSIF